MVADRGPRLTIMAEMDPLVFMRILQLIGSLNLVPRRASAVLLDDEAIRIDLELPVHERLRYEYFCKRVLALPTVISMQCDDDKESET